MKTGVRSEHVRHYAYVLSRRQHGAISRSGVGLPHLLLAYTVPDSFSSARSSCRLSCWPKSRLQMAEGLPGRLQPCANRLGRERQVADELGVTSAAAVGRLAGRLLQIAGRQPGIEVVQQGAVVQQRAAAAPLGVSGDLPPVQRQIGPPGDRQARDVERRRRWPEG